MKIVLVHLYGTTHCHNRLRKQQSCSIHHCMCVQLTVTPDQRDNSPVPYSTVCAYSSLSHQINVTAVLFHTALYVRTAHCHIRSTRQQSCSIQHCVHNMSHYHTRSSSYLSLCPIQYQSVSPVSHRTSTLPCESAPSSALILEGMAMTVPGPPPSCTQSPLFTVHLSLSPLFTVHLPLTALFIVHLPLSHLFTVHLSLFICHHCSSVTTVHCSHVTVTTVHCSPVTVTTVHCSSATVTNVHCSSAPVTTVHLSLTPLFICHCSLLALFTTDLSLVTKFTAQLSLSTFFTIDLSLSKMFTAHLSLSALFTTDLP